MREWKDLYSDSKKQKRPLLKKVINQLVIYIEKDYEKGISLSKEYQQHLKTSFQDQITQESESTELFEKRIEPAETITEDLSTDSEERQEKLRFYLDPILSSLLDQRMTKEDFYYYLPPLNSTEDFYYLIRILYALTKEKKEYLSILEGTTGKEYQDILEEINRVEEKMRYIHEYLSPETMEENKTYTEENVLVFLETANSNACLLSDLKSKEVPSESYPSFIRLLRSIQDGSFQNIKKLETDASLYEVKDGSSRVVFTRVYKNYYCVLTAFIKKSLWEKELRQNLRNVTNNYLSQASMIYGQLREGNIEYLEKQKEFEEQLFSLLEEKSMDGGDKKCLKY